MDQEQIKAIRQLKSEGKTIEQIAGEVGLETGDVQTAIATLDLVAAGAADGATGLRVVKFDFAFDAPGLTDGVEAYVPTVGERLFDAWVEVDTEWDGTTPKADFGLFVGSVHGLNAVNGVGDIRIDLPWANPPLDYTFNPGTGLLTPQNATGGTGGVGYYMAGAVFTTTDPFKVVVSQDGTAGGADPGATQGRATLYLLVISP